ncbi:DUF2064 domain-containing protein [Actinoplanes sp. NPDC026670]|uniref:TIGR04282 family arsenosugar biosynthesis glycosyltransferase n=1 Tax=Actinoplanes sp. NPDC026670 TaxID=3154700 RepID=UPI0033D1D404
MTASQILVLAKEPRPGRVKTRLCPPCTPEQAAGIAAAALADTLDTVSATHVDRRILVVDGEHPAPPGWLTVPQRGGPLDERLAGAFADTRVAGAATVLIGMDTPQITAGRLAAALEQLHTPDGPDAVLGPAADGGWWALGLRDAGDATVLRGIVTSTADTGEHTLTALHRRGLRVAMLPELCDVDTADDARQVAALCPPDSRFALATAVIR